LEGYICTIKKKYKNYVKKKHTKKIQKIIQNLFSQSTLFYEETCDLVTNLFWDGLDSDFSHQSGHFFDRFYLGGDGKSNHYLPTPTPKEKEREKSHKNPKSTKTPFKTPKDYSKGENINPSNETWEKNLDLVWEI
jgi:hypothetical protein